MADQRLEDRRTFEEFLTDLAADDAPVRSEAAKALGGLRDPRAVESLIQALADPDSYVCDSAIAALGELCDPRAVGPLLDLLARNQYHLKDPNLNQPVIITRALARLGDAGFRALVQMLREYVEHEFVGSPAAQTLGEIGDVRAIDTLILALGSRVYEVGEAAAQALRSLGEPAVVPLVQMLRAERSMTGFHAMQALGWIGTPAVPLLIDALRDEQHANARYHAAGALGYIGDDRAHEPLRHALGDENDGVRLQAALALSALGDPDTSSWIGPLLTGLDTEQYGLAQEIRGALKEIGKSAIEPLTNVLSDTGRSPVARARAASLLGELGDPSTIPVLAAALAGKDPDVRAAAALALGQLQAGETAEALYQMAQDESASVRSCALLALAQLEDTRALPLLVPLLNDIRNVEVKTPEQVPGRAAMLNRAALALSLFGDQALEPLEEMLESDDPSKWFWATRALGQMGESGLALLLRAARDQRPLMRAARDRRPLMRQFAFLALSHYLWLHPGHGRDAGLVEVCITALEDTASQVADHAASMLGEFGDQRAIEPLIRLLERSGPNSPNLVSISGMAAARALERLGDPRAIPALMKAHERAGPGNKRVYLEAANRIAKRAEEQADANED